MSPTVVIAICSTIVILGLIFRKNLGNMIDAIAEAVRKMNLRKLKAGKDGLELEGDATGTWDQTLLPTVPPGKELVIIIRDDQQGLKELEAKVKELNAPEAGPLELTADYEGRWEELDSDERPI